MTKLITLTSVVLLTASATADSSRFVNVTSTDTDPTPGRVAPDNSGKNKEVKKGAVTADQQKNNRADLQMTTQIRRAIVREKGLSISAKNVKIITQDGLVTLKGPVNNEREKNIVEQTAYDLAGSANVLSNIEVKP